MLEKLFGRPRVLQRIRSNPLGPVLEKYTAYLARRGHASCVVQQYVLAAEHFGRWLGRRPMNRRAVRTFIARHLPVCRCQPPAIRSVRGVRASLNHLLEMSSVPADQSNSASSADDGSLLERYAHYLAKVHGLAPETVRYRLRHAGALLASLHVSGTQKLAALTVDSIRRFMSRECRRCRPSSAQVIAASIRSFLRFLLLHELIGHDLSIAVASPPNWRLASLPATVSAAELEQLVNAVDAGTLVGLRDQAILLCLIDLGLRASDVADLQLAGVEFSAKVLHLRRRKQRQPDAVPMTGRLVAAVAAYVQRARPHCSSPNLFVQHCAPRGAALTSSGIRSVVRRRAAQAGLGHRIHGTHVIRHSVASRLINAGATLKQIADLLGHHSIETTAIYAKVDLTSLAQVALPWPTAQEVAP